MIGHDDVFVQVQFPAYFKRSNPFIADNFPEIGKTNTTLVDVSQTTFPVLSNQGNKIDTITRIVPLRHPVRLNPVFISESFHEYIVVVIAVCCNVRTVPRQFLLAGQSTRL